MMRLPVLKRLLRWSSIFITLPLYAVEGQPFDLQVDQKLDNYVAQEMIALATILPVRLDQFSRITSATYLPQVNMVVYEIEFDTDLFPGTSLDETRKIAKSQCVINACLILDFKILLQMGVALQHKFYTKSTGDDLFSYDIVAGNCDLETLSKFELFILLD